MKKLTKVLIFILCATFAFSACNKNGGEVFVQDTHLNVKNGIHLHSVNETAEYLLKDSKTPYKIVLPSNPDNLQRMAAIELNKFFYESTGVEFPVIDELTATDDGKYISIGCTSLLKSAGLTAGEQLKKYGYQIVTKGDDVFLFGLHTYGDIYAVYEFLRNILNFEFFFTDTYSLNKDVKDIKLMNYDITEVPDIEFRAANYGYMRENVETQMRLRVTPYQDFFMLIDGAVGHTSLCILDPAKNKNHADYWYNNNQTQVCYTAHGDEKEYKEMVEASALRLIQASIEYPDRDIVTFTTADNGDVCECKTCRESKIKYGADSASVILFINDVRAKINEKFLTEEFKANKRDFDILFFAYSSYVEAPAEKINSTGEYAPKQGIQCADGVAVWMAPIHADFTTKMSAVENLVTRERTAAWKSVSPSMYLWYYSTNFKHYLAPYDTFDAMPDTYKYMKNVDAKMIFNQGQYDNSGSATGFSILKGYLNAKLAWNVNSDYGKLIDEFFATCYGDAAPMMRDLFDSLRAHTRMLKDTKAGYDGVFSCYNDYSKETLWRKEVVSSFKLYINEAIKTIEGIKEVDYEAYQKQYLLVTAERIWIDYLLIQLYSYNTSDTEIAELKKEFVADFTLSGMNKYTESHDVSALYKIWGI